MSDFIQIEKKLQQFSRKYYTNELIKGSIVFITLGVLYLFFTLFIEYFLWLQPTSRTILFWTFILIEVFLLVRFIGFPIFKLFGLQKGISFEDASKIIGDHFPEVKDKLLNILQLKNNDSQSDLLLASISQKANELQPVQFTNAVNFKGNSKYLKYVLIPVFIWLVTLFTGFNKKLTQSFNRVVNYTVAYTPPAPFSLILTAENLEVIQGESLTIYVETKGEVIPDEAKIYYNDQQYFLQNDGSGFFSYSFSEINTPIDFYIGSNDIVSPNYSIKLIKTPTIQNVAMRLIYPGYLRKGSEDIPNTRNVTVPQGTRIEWNVKTLQTDSVTFIQQDKRTNFKSKNKDNFEYSRRIVNDLSYKIATSNQQLKDYEKLQFSVGVINDEHPDISVKSNIDSITRGPVFFAGQISDDYGLKKLQLVYYDQQNPQLQNTKNISINKENIQTFFYQFPEGIDLQEGVNYELFFQVFDNDGINGSKKTSSKKFSYKQNTEEEVKEQLLKEQKDHINDLENSLEKQQQNKKDLEKLQFDLQNKKNMNWNDQKKIKNIVDRQQQYKKMMQRQTKKLQENFDEKKEKNERLQEKKEDLKKRIEELKKLEKQQKLLDDLIKMAEKLNKEDLIKKSKELAQQNKQQERSLERILEMAKRYYVEQKTTQIADKLKELAKKQDELSKKENQKDAKKNTEKDTPKEAQEDIKKDFEKVQEEMKNLQKENEELKEPMDIPKMEDLQKETKDELNKAEENLEQSKPKDAKKNQQKASDKMKQMANKMEKSMEMMSDEMQEENMEDLRQVLENLITFSFDQEELMDKFEGISAAHPDYGKNLKKQYQLKTYFEHIDDSLYVLSIRVPKISSKVQKHLADIYYNTDQSLENFAETRFNEGVANQRYIMTSTNELVDMLSNTLDAMKNAKPGSGKGKGKSGESFSLPDIIQKQGDLMKKMKEGMQKKGESGKPKDGKDGKEGEKGEDGKPKDGKGEKQGGKGEGKGENEDLNGELYEIYKQQAELRQQLEDALKEGGGGNGNAKKALKQMEELERQILDKGFTQESLNKMQKLNYELLKLDKATFEQGRDNKRKANSNTTDYNENKAKQLEFKKLFYNQTEILNRQSLPLRQNYKNKVKEYFSIPETNQ